MQSIFRKKISAERSKEVNRKERKAFKTYSFSLTCLLLLIFQFGCVDGFATPFGIGALLFQPKGLVTKSAEGNVPALLEASDFFIDAFWVGKVGGGATELSDRQRRTLSSSQFYEFRSRYAGAGRGQSELVVCRLPTGEMAGCAGIEVSGIPNKSLKSSIATTAPLMSNLAVGREFRRKGIAEKLVTEVERVVQYEWGYDECYLYVEERNKPAVKLYQKLGYRKVWVDKEASTLLPARDGKLQNSSTNIVCMRKRLNLGLIGRIWPFS